MSSSRPSQPATGWSETRCQACDQTNEAPWAVDARANWYKATYKDEYVDVLVLPDGSVERLNVEAA